MSRIVLTTIGSFGDLHPKISLALELRKRGHDIVFATHKEYQSKIEALGFEFQRMRPDNTALNDPEEMARMMDLKTGTDPFINSLSMITDVDSLFSSILHHLINVFLGYFQKISCHAFLLIQCDLFDIHFRKTF